MIHQKKLIEVALPLEAINQASAHEKLVKVGKPTNLHLWWARRPLAAARALIFAQMVDDPSARPDIFPTEKAQQKERQRLFRIIEDMVLWENTADEKILERARAEIWQSWRHACAVNVDHPRAKHLFDRKTLPSFHDPFAGGGALPLEAQRLGLDSYASDLNPVAVLICKAMIEIPSRFAGKPPANPLARQDRDLLSREWRGTQGLAADVRFYGEWICDEARKRLGHLYPEVQVAPEMAKGRADLKPLVGKKLTVIGWLWARTVKSPNPAFAHVDVPLASTFILSSKAGRETYVDPVIEAGRYHFTIRVGRPRDPEAAAAGTSIVSRDARGKKIKVTGFRCLLSGVPITTDQVQTEGKANRMGARMMAIVAEGERGRVYLPPTPEMEKVAFKARPAWRPDVEFFQQALGFRVGNYGMETWTDLFTSRQLVALTTFSDLVQEARERVKRDILAAGVKDEGKGLAAEGDDATAYADAIAVFLGLVLSRVADWNNSLSRWESKAQVPQQLFGRQTISMTWDYCEANPLSSSTGSFTASLKNLELSFTKGSADRFRPGHSSQADAATQTISMGKVVSTDPPYYDNIGYADLSDFFYTWLRRTLKQVFPDLFATVAVPKTEELVATPGRHGSKEEAEAFFLKGMKQAMHRLAEQSHPAFPVTIYYAFKQSETDGLDGTASTGWETFLEAVLDAGFAISGTWPMRTENTSRLRGQSSNALASSIVLVCRPQGANAPTATRREFMNVLSSELPAALLHLQRSNIAPADLAQAAIGPGMAVYTRYAKVLDANGKPLSVRAALALINQTLDAALAEQEGDFDADTRWALAWFEQSGFSEGEFGVADVLARAKNTSVEGMRDAGILKSSRGKVRLLKPDELPADWNPSTDTRLSAWETVHHCVRVLATSGEGAAAELVTKLGTQAETARELAYRLYTLCDRKKRPADALTYNGLVQSWPEIARLAREGSRPTSPELPYPDRN